MKITIECKCGAKTTVTYTESINVSGYFNSPVQIGEIDAYDFSDGLEMRCKVCGAFSHGVGTLKE